MNLKLGDTSWKADGGSIFRRASEMYCISFHGERDEKISVIEMLISAMHVTIHKSMCGSKTISQLEYA